MSDRISHMAMHRMKDVAIKTKENVIYYNGICVAIQRRQGAGL